MSEPKVEQCPLVVASIKTKKPSPSESSLKFSFILPFSRLTPQVEQPSGNPGDWFCLSTVRSPGPCPSIVLCEFGIQRDSMGDHGSAS